MVRIKVISFSHIIYYIVVITLVILLILSTGRLIIKPGLKNQAQITQELDDKANDTKGSVVYTSVLTRGLPVFINEKKSLQGNSLTEIFRWIKDQDIRNPVNIMTYQMPYLNSVEQGYDMNKPEVVEVSRDGSTRPEVHPSDTGETEIILKSEPKNSEEIKIEIARIKDDLEPIQMSGDGPQILVYHSHSREAYKQDPDNPYKVAEAFRSNDLNHTVVKVGSELSKHLNKLNIPTLHDTTEHEQGSYNSSYQRSLKTIKKQQEQHDSLQIFLDIHRNAYQEGVRSPDDEVVIIDGKRVAKIFVVIGTGEGASVGFENRPNWQENYKFASKLTNTINEMYPGLAKPVLVKKGRYNQHVSNKAILIEVGSNLTTQKEAERATRYLAEGISKIVE